MLPETRISVPLSNDEYVALSRLAVQEMRAPREQARFILRSVLMGAHLPIDTSTQSTDEIQSAPISQ